MTDEIVWIDVDYSSTTDNCNSNDIKDINKIENDNVEEQNNEEENKSPEDYEDEHLNECQNRLRNNIKEALHLLDQLNFEPKKRNYDLLMNDEKITSPISKDKDQSISSSITSKSSVFCNFQLTANSYEINDIEMETPNAILMIPNTPNIVISDNSKGIIIYDMSTKIQKTIKKETWRYCQGLAYDWRKEEIYTIITKKDDSIPHSPTNYLTILDQNTFEIKDSIELPKILQEIKLNKIKITLAPNGILYMSLNSQGCGSLFEYEPKTKKWTEIAIKRGHFYIDIIVLKIIDSITEILLLEESKGYIVMESIWNSMSAARGIISPVIKPTALTSSFGSGRIFVIDNSISSAVELSKENFEKIKNIVLVESGKNLMYAMERYLIILNIAKKNIKLQLV
ncbi:Six-bladed beta-propeller, TolB-like domain-containing protein [Strongyloides ratti]|uniref:Six-bladed beta-propeller, TolB-like domain-containing protein n=1 Tax=Strongyloides ratti TaxID=34506 RepID=A0A090LNN6_STRRB|nr:Six-bladed beta-propeller, TolB-like domain-containing protein [Strongyloides ratti]CEF71480.1 Six-bladed beta-propeller, TolB-like domain-containing protein [Strongyloides ratti]